MEDRIPGWLSTTTLTALASTPQTQIARLRGIWTMSYPRVKASRWAYSKNEQLGMASVAQVCIVNAGILDASDSILN